MGGLFRAARANRPTPSLPNTVLNIQTSVQGRPRPIGCGTALLAGNIIDIQDFFAIPNFTNASSPSGHAGKGGLFRSSPSAAPQIESYSYYAAVLISLCEGPIISVNRFTGDGITLGTYPSPAAGGTVFTGTQTQQAWAYMAARHPDHALSYRGEACIGFGPMLLGTSASVPSFQFETTFAICGAGPDFPEDANPRDWLTAYLSNEQWGVPGFPASIIGDWSAYANCCQALGLVVSVVEADQVAARQHIDDMLLATNAEMFMSNGLLQIAPYWDTAVTAHGATFTPNNTPVYDLTPDDFLPLEGGSVDADDKTPIGIKKRAGSKLKNKVIVEYIDRSNTYTATPIDHKDEASITMTRERPTDTRTLHMFKLQSAASMSAHLQLTREQIGTLYYFRLPKSFTRVEPMDLLRLPLDQYDGYEESVVVRVRDTTENADYTITFEAEEFLGTATAPAYARQGISHGVPDFNADPGDINTPILFEPPFNIGEPALAVFCGISGQDPEWGGADAFVSYDRVNYILAGRIKGASRMGVTTAVLPSVTRSGTLTIDAAHSLAVDMTESLSTLNPASVEDMDNGNTACWLADTGEIIAYQNAVLTGANRYALSPLQRGAFGTAIASHSAGTPFVRIDGTVFKLPFDKSRIGATVYIKFVSFNVYGGGQKTIDQVDEYSYVIQGAALNSEYHYTPEVASLAGTDHVLVVGADGARKRAPLTALETLMGIEGTLAYEVAAANAAIEQANTTIAANATQAHTDFLSAQNLANDLFSQAETDIGAVSTAVTSEIATRKSGDTQSAVKIDNVTAAASQVDWSDFNDFFSQIRIGLASNDNVRARAVADFTFAGVQQVATALQQAGLSFASFSTTVAATIGDVQAYFNAAATARVQGDQANADSIAQVKAKTDDNTAQIVLLQSATSNPAGTFATLETSLSAGYQTGDDFAALNDFFNQWQAGQADKAAKLLAHQAIAGVKANESALADATRSIATMGFAIAARFGDAFAAVAQNATAIATATEEIANLSLTISTQGAQITSNTLAITNAQGDIATIDTTLDTHGVEISQHTSAISTLQGDVGTVENTISLHGVEISQNATALSSINGVLAGRYTVKLDAGGNIVGMSFIAGGGDTSRVAFLADNFTISSPSHPDLVAFGILNINGTPQLAINGNNIGDLSLLNPAIANNAVSNRASASGPSGNTGAIGFDVRAGATILLVLSTSDIYNIGSSAVAAGPTLRITLNGSMVEDFPLQYVGGLSMYPGVAVYQTIAGSSAHWTASGSARYASNATGNPNEPIPVSTRIVALELDK